VVPVFLSEEWVAALASAAATAEVAAGTTLSVRQVVDDVSWTVRVAAGRVSVDRGADADVTITTDRATAAALVLGDLATQDAFAGGRLRLGGDLAKLLAAADGLAGLDAAYAGVRADTTY
jgi:predicted lipid carrier protein YhbT